MHQLTQAEKEHYLSELAIFFGKGSGWGIHKPFHYLINAALQELHQNELLSDRVIKVYSNVYGLTITTVPKDLSEITLLVDRQAVKITQPLRDASRMSSPVADKAAKTFLFQIDEFLRILRDEVKLFDTSKKPYSKSTITQIKTLEKKLHEKPNYKRMLDELLSSNTQTASNVVVEH